MADKTFSMIFTKNGIKVVRNSDVFISYYFDYNLIYPPVKFETELLLELIFYKMFVLLDVSMYISDCFCVILYEWDMMV